MKKDKYRLIKTAEKNLDKLDCNKWIVYGSFGKDGKKVLFHRRLRTQEEITEYQELIKPKAMANKTLLSKDDYVWIRKDDENHGEYGQVIDVKESDEGEVYVVKIRSLYEAVEYLADDLELDDLPF